jgi:MoaA/NifB/PqqE/SkfB family radical SAM enzyme
MVQSEALFGFEKVGLIVGIVHACPMNCIMCHFENKNQPVAPEVRMDESLWQDILHKLAEEKITVGILTVSMWGESPLHPEFGRFMELAANMNQKHSIYEKLDFYTCGVFLKKKDIDLLLEKSKSSKLNLEKVVFGLDAATESTYNQIRRNGNFNAVVENLRYFVRKRTELGVTGPRAVIEFLFQPKNADELPNFIEYWEKFFREENLPLIIAYDYFKFLNRTEDALFIKRCNMDSMEEQAEVGKLHKKALYELGVITKEEFHGGNLLYNDYYEEIENRENKELQLRRPCPTLWSILALNSKGIATACCVDQNFVHNLGDISKQSFREIWFGEKLKNLRIAHLLGNFSQSPVCSHCKNQDGGPLGDLYYEEYLRFIHREDLIAPFHQRFLPETKPKGGKG